MANWNEEGKEESYWTQEIISVLADVHFDDPFEYDADFLVYDGDYIQGMTNWYAVGTNPTSWT